MSMGLLRLSSSLALALSVACATTRPADVHRLGQKGDTDAVLAAWERADNDAVRVAIIEELAAHPDDARGQRLVVGQATRASTEPVKLAAVRALAAYAGTEPARAAIEALADPWPAVREVAQSSLSSRLADATPELLRVMATSTSPLVRAGSAKLLAGAPASRPELRAEIEDALLARATRDDAPKVRESAVIALGQLAVARVRSELVELMRTDPDAGVRMAAERAISKLGAKAEPTAVVAVLPLKNDTGLRDADVERLGGEIADFVAAKLSASKVCQVVDPAKMELAIRELKKVGAAMYDGDAPNAPAIGRFKIANQLVFGSVQRQGSTFTLILDRMDLATLARVPGAAVTVRGYRPDLEQMKERAATELVATFR